MAIMHPMGLLPPKIEIQQRRRSVTTDNDVRAKITSALRRPLS
jgi:hypothetical protein